MRKSVITLLALLVCGLLPLHAYEYFTIYFSDGTKSNAFYATDVDSICYSKVGLDSIAYADWQVQEIYTCDSVYRYSLAQIDSLSFKDVDINKVAENIINVIVKCESLLGDVVVPETLESQLQTIRQFEEVDDAYMNNRTLFVDIKDWGSVSFNYPLDENANNITDNTLSQVLAASRQRQYVGTHEQFNPISACIANQQAKDENRLWFDEIANDVKGAFDSMGISCKKINMPKLSFFKEEIFNYDLVFLKTHGCYDPKYGLHWLLTGQELFSHSDKWDTISKNYKEICNFLKDHDISPYKKTIVHHEEKRNGRKTHVYYIAISDEYIRSVKSNFKNAGSAIVFNTACESMKGNILVNKNMAKAFLNRGAGVYLGYDDTNNMGAEGGSAFFFYLLSGMSVSRSYNAMPDSCKKRDLFLYLDDYNVPKIDYKKKQGTQYVADYHPVLQIEPDKSELCITHPETLEADNYSNSDGIIILKGKMKMLESLNLSYYNTFSNDSNIYGFQLSTNPDMSQIVDSIAKHNYDSITHYMNWADTLDVSTLQPNTTYYYRAYMNDGVSNCYGEIMSFTTNEGNELNGDEEAYFVMNSKTVTFYYDNLKNERNGREITFYNEHGVASSNSIFYDWATKAVFDSSFANYYPTTTACWFNGCQKLQTIENLNYLNTSNVTEMQAMFACCRSLTSLDLSNFNTTNVTNMGSMFLECLSLTNIIVSSFDTSKVTNMHGMFANCSSLQTLDLTNFDVSGIPFGNADEMFIHCYNLRTIFAGNWARGSGEMYMFNGCTNLRGGAGTKAWNGCGGSYAHIDGGKAWPGLFTAK